MNYKKVLQALEHIALIALIAGSIGFYLGNQYGHTQVDVKALSKAGLEAQTAQNTSK